MFIHQLYTNCLAQAAYYIESEGEALIVDPLREPYPYLELAKHRGAKIKYVFETHFHADFVSGHHELSARTGARIYLGAHAGAAFPHVAVRDGDEINFGKCRLRFLETPGHTVESICILVTDLERSIEPFAVLTGEDWAADGLGSRRPAAPRGWSWRRLVNWRHRSR